MPKGSWLLGDICDINDQCMFSVDEDTLLKSTRLISMNWRRPGGLSAMAASIYTIYSQMVGANQGAMWPATPPRASSSHPTASPY